MGEYAIRKSDRERVKIGTCADMYYLRFEDRNKVSYDDGWADLRFRIPFLDEDKLQPGEYDVYNRGLLLRRGSEYFQDVDKGTDSESGMLQIRHEATGLLIQIPCHHGERLPAMGDKAGVHWNGKMPSYVLSSIRSVQVEGGLTLWPVVRCVHCNQAWRYEWDEILPWVPDIQLRERLEGYRPDASRTAAPEATTAK
jgi:hypothetical protein